jgi:hypothetical protein
MVVYVHHDSHKFMVWADEWVSRTRGAKFISPFLGMLEKDIITKFKL